MAQTLETEDTFYSSGLFYISFTVEKGMALGLRNCQDRFGHTAVTNESYFSGLTKNVSHLNHDKYPTRAIRWFYVLLPLWESN